MRRRTLALILALLLLPLCSLAEQSPASPVIVMTSSASTDALLDESLPLAEEITMSCFYNDRPADKMRTLNDGNYRPYMDTRVVNNESSLTIRSDDKPIGGVYIMWRTNPFVIDIQSRDESGAWVTVDTVAGKFYQQYYMIDDLQEVRFIPHDNPRMVMSIAEVWVFTSGRPREKVHLWQEAPFKVDMMLVHGHPDDEVLWFGGLLPTYGGQLQKKILVVDTSISTYNRRLELLDSVWTCGIRIHPAIGHFADISTSDMTRVLASWKKDAIYSFITELYRKHKPDVVITHDFNGEYGHGVHKATALAVREAVLLAQDAAVYPDSAAIWGTWNVKKLYVHLYGENQIHMDWWQPLSAFGGMTSQDVAREAFLCHISQQGRRWAVNDGGEYDNALFGLYYTTVGPDVIGGDLLENID